MSKQEMNRLDSSNKNSNNVSNVNNSSNSQSSNRMSNQSNSSNSNNMNNNINNNMNNNASNSGNSKSNGYSSSNNSLNSNRSFNSSAPATKIEFGLNSLKPKSNCTSSVLSEDAFGSQRVRSAESHDLSEMAHRRVYTSLYGDIGRDNLENDLPYADLQDL